MSCTSTSYGPTTENQVTTAAAVPGDATNLTGQYLVVSNSPETLTRSDIQLYKCQIPLSANTTQRIRVFIWHVAQATSNTFNLAAYVGAGTATITNFVGHVENTTNYTSAGICCAQAVLYDSYDGSYACNCRRRRWTDNNICSVHCRRRKFAARKPKAICP